MIYWLNPLEMSSSNFKDIYLGWTSLSCDIIRNSYAPFEIIQCKNVSPAIKWILIFLNFQFDSYLCRSTPLIFSNKEIRSLPLTPIFKSRISLQPDGVNLWNYEYKSVEQNKNHFFNISKVYDTGLLRYRDLKFRVCGKSFLPFSFNLLVRNV